MTKLVEIAALAALIGLLITGCDTKIIGGPGNNEEFVPVTNIVGVKTIATVGTHIFGGTVVPSNATNKTIIWSAEDEEDLEFTEGTISGNKLTTKRPGTIAVKATIENGLSEGKDYIKKYYITVDPVVPVTNIIGVPVWGFVGDLDLYPVVLPDNATNMNIIWSIKDRGTTWATIKNETVTTKAEGVLIITATIINGIAEGTNFTADFYIYIYQVLE